MLRRLLTKMGRTALSVPQRGSYPCSGARAQLSYAYSGAARQNMQKMLITPHAARCISYASSGALRTLPASYLSGSVMCLNRRNNNFLVPQETRAVKGRMLSSQEALPKLPVPPLGQTLQKYLRCLRPLYDDEQYRHAEQLIQEFGKPGGEGEKLQALLEQRAEQKDNWLSEYWLNTAYLDFRYPCPIHVNPGILLLDNDFSGVEQQVQFAAKWVSGVLDYKSMVDDQSLPVEYMGKDPLCMDQYFKILHACRIPGLKRDRFEVYPNETSRHMCVMRNNHIFSVPVYGENGQVLSTNQIADQLKVVVDQSQRRGPPLGILTSDGRNQWAKVYERLCKDRTNAKLLEEIHQSIFVLCLDKPNPVTKTTSKITQMANQMNHGLGSKANSCNRWFDKTVQFIVGEDGAVGVNYEHCSAEGPPILSLVDHAMTYVEHRKSVEVDAPGVKPPSHLNFNFDTKIGIDFDKSMAAFDSLINDLDMVALQFDGYGKEFAKAQKLSPDALIQISIQLAYFRTYKRNTATYESGSLRRFKEGRTDTIRSCTVASDAFCRAMENPDVNGPERVRLLKEAVSAHRQYSNDVLQGQGVDRHLLGLKLTAIEHGMDVPELFMDPAYSQSLHYRLSTSQVPSRHNALLTFGPVVPDGYGICYNPMPHRINFCVSAWRSCGDTNAEKMLNTLVKALNDTRDLLLNNPVSKL